MELLDEDFAGRRNPYRTIAPSGVRIANFAIDQITIGFLTYAGLHILNQALSGISPFDPGDPTLPLTYLVVRWMYYFISESTTGKTFGKVLTGSQLLTTKGESLSIAQLLLRTTLRFVPLYAVFYLIGMRWHDRLADCNVYVR